jgi:hypothetical protein
LATNDTSGQLTLADFPKREPRYQRHIPLPTTISHAAQEWLQRAHYGESWSDIHLRLAKARGLRLERDLLSIGELREVSALMAQLVYERYSKIIPTTVREENWSGVDVFVVEPADGVPPAHENRLLINLSGNAEILPVTQPLEGLPLCDVLKARVAVVRYRYAPEHVYPAAPEDALTVYRHALTTRALRSEHIGVFGSSAGGLVARQLTSLAVREGVPVPGALGLLSPSDPGVVGDTYYTNADVDATRDYLKNVDTGGVDSFNPPASLVRADLRAFPPTYLAAGTRDHLLSTTVLLHRALLHAGARADLHVFEAMPHAHWVSPELPESKDLYHSLGHFFATHLGFEFQPKYE